jgi:hypothetical protein
VAVFSVNDAEQSGSTSRGLLGWFMEEFSSPRNLPEMERHVSCCQYCTVEILS